MTGEYAVDGVAVEKASLADMLKSKQRPGQRLGVHVQPAAQAPYEAVHAAMAACQQVGANVGLVGNKQFVPREAASGSGA